MSGKRKATTLAPSRKKARSLQQQWFDLKWLNKFKELEVYKKDFGHCKVPQRYPLDQPLANWVNKQRMGKRKGLSAEKEKLLDSLGFTWRVQRYPQWSDKFKELKAYKKEFGHCRVPPMYPLNEPLANWVISQRAQKGESLERTKLLDDLDFVWSVIDLNWFNKFKELEGYKKEFGHCKVPQSYPLNQPLANWVEAQRLGRKD